MGRDASSYFHLVFFLALTLLAGCSTTGSAPETGEAGAGPEELMAAVRANEDRAVLELLSRGVRPDAQAGAEQTPLMVAATNGNRRIVRLLLAAGAEVNARSADGNTAVIQAAENGHLAVVRALLAAGANVNVSQGGESLLMKVVASGDLLTAEMLLAAGADVHYRRADGTTALDLARAVARDQHELALDLVRVEDLDQLLQLGVLLRG